VAVMYPDGASLAYKIDHVGVCMPGVEEAFRFCHDRLALPVAWPFARYGAAHTGGIGLGNLNLEFLDPGLPFLAPRQPAGIGLVPFSRRHGRLMISPLPSTTEGSLIMVLSPRAARSPASPTSTSGPSGSTSGSSAPTTIRDHTTMPYVPPASRRPAEERWPSGA
jgi:hypothetical protein